MLKKFIIIVFLILLLNTQNSCSFGMFKISDIKYIFYTEEIDKQNASPYHVIQGEELKRWYTSNDIEPNVFDLIVYIKNLGNNVVKQPKLHVELWLSESPQILIKDQNSVELNIEQMKKAAKWFKYWERNIPLEDLKPKELQKIKVDRVRIAEITKSEYDNKKLTLMGWNCKVTSGDLKLDKPFEISFLD